MQKRKIEYLRKSRSDDPRQTVEEVLEKHETMLREYAMREWGYAIPEEDIYREVVSGESIDERVEIKKLLARIEDPDVEGVLVVEPQRLSRGDLEDCGRLINAFRFSKTKIYTPMMTYDLERKMDRKFFQDELLRGREYLEYTKEILTRGRIAAVRRGCYLPAVAPYGYKKITIGHDPTLEPIPEEAEVMQMVFQLYVRGDSLGSIAQRLIDSGVPTKHGGTWRAQMLSKMIRNVHYIGKVSYNKSVKTPVLENGEIVYKRLPGSEEDVIIVEGKHPAIIDQATWDAAQERFRRSPSVNTDRELQNPLAGIMRCAKCGKMITVKKIYDGRRFYICKGLCIRQIDMPRLQDALVFALENSELPALELKIKNGDGDARKIQERLIARLTKQLQEYRAQEEKQYEMLETGRYTLELFDRRNAELRAKMDACENNIYKARAVLPESVNYEERVATLKDAIAALKDDELTPKEKNDVLKQIVQEVQLTGEVPGRPGGRPAPPQFRLDVFLRL